MELYIFLNQKKNEYFIPGKFNNELIWLSIKNELFYENINRLSIKENGIYISMPLLGTFDPLVIFTRGKPVDAKIKLPGGSVTLDKVVYKSKRGAWMAVGVFIVCMVSLGYLVGSARWNTSV